MKWQDIPGWSCPRIIELYDEMAAELKPGAVAVECGVAYGKSLAYLASVLHPGVDILAVDIWQTFQGRTAYREAFELARCKRWSPIEAAQANILEAFGFENDTRTARYPDGSEAQRRVERIEWVQARSEDVPLYLDFEADFVFLDDHHEEGSVAREIRAWLPKLKSGGVISGHDVNANYPGVERAVRSILGHGSDVEIRPPAPGENGWGGVWKWRKP